MFYMTVSLFVQHQDQCVCSKVGDREGPPRFCCGAVIPATECHVKKDMMHI